MGVGNRLCSWYRVETAFVPGVASCDSSAAKVATLQQSVGLYGFLGVMRTRWVKTALRPDQQAQAVLVKGNELDGESGNHAGSSGRV